MNINGLTPVVWNKILDEATPNTVKNKQLKNAHHQYIAIRSEGEEEKEIKVFESLSAIKNAGEGWKKASLSDISNISMAIINKPTTSRVEQIAIADKVALMRNTKMKKFFSLSFRVSNLALNILKVLMSITIIGLVGSYFIHKWQKERASHFANLQKEVILPIFQQKQLFDSQKKYRLDYLNELENTLAPLAALSADEAEFLLKKMEKENNSNEDINITFDEYCLLKGIDNSSSTQLTKEEYDARKKAFETHENYSLLKSGEIQQFVERSRSLPPAEDENRAPDQKKWSDVLPGVVSLFRKDLNRNMQSQVIDPKHPENNYEFKKSDAGSSTGMDILHYAGQINHLKTLLSVHQSDARWFTYIQTALTQVISNTGADTPILLGLSLGVQPNDLDVNYIPPQDRQIRSPITATIYRRDDDSIEKVHVTCQIESPIEERLGENSDNSETIASVVASLSGDFKISEEGKLEFHNFNRTYEVKRLNRTHEVKQV